MWQPEPGWTPVPGGRGVLTAGLWRAEDGGRPWVLKRIRRPEADEPEFLDPGGAAYWRREAEIAADHDWLRGLRHPEVLRVEEDIDGYTVWTALHDPASPPSLFVASALAGLAAAEPPDRPWLARGLFAERIRMMAAGDGWPTLARTTFADLADELWRRRGGVVERYEALPVHLAHGDVVPGNIVHAEGQEAITVDWSCCGLAPAGADLGYFALSCREDFEVLLGSYLDAPGATGLEPADVRFAAEAMAVYTVVARAEWALARVAKGEGALAAKFRHPAVAPHLRALQRHFPQVESLLNPRRAG